MVLKKICQADQNLGQTYQDLHCLPYKIQNCIRTINENVTLCLLNKTLQALLTNNSKKVKNNFQLLEILSKTFPNWALYKTILGGGQDNPGYLTPRGVR